MITNISTKTLPIYTFNRAEYNHIEVDLYHIDRGNMRGRIVNGSIKLSVSPVFKRDDGVITKWGVPTVITVLNDVPVWDDKFSDLKPDPKQEKELIDAVLKELKAELNN